VAVLVDEAFRVLGLREAVLYVKGLLGLIEYPPREYERIVAVVATSERLSRREIGRHSWARLELLWNLGWEGFRELYDELHVGKPGYEYAWRMSGGNPRMLGELLANDWRADDIVERLIEAKDLSPGFLARWRRWLEEAVEDPDVLWSPEAPRELVEGLIERNLIVYSLPDRTSIAWLDEPPRERDPVLGVGRRVAWQTPLHREAVRRALRLLG